MLFWLFLILTVIGVITYMIYDSDASALALIIGVVGTIISIVIFAANYLGLEGTIAEYKEHYNTIMFEVENKLYDDDVTTVSQRELVKEIQHWNCDLAKKKAIQHNLWIGIYILDIYDDFEFIPLEGLLKEGEAT
jgi:hypothetical protein